MKQEHYHTNERLKKLFESYLESYGKESDFARNEISFLEKMTGEQVVNVLSKIELKNLTLLRDERKNMYNMIEEIKGTLDDNSKEHEEKIQDVYGFLRKYDNFVGNPSGSSE